MEHFSNTKLIPRYQISTQSWPFSYDSWYWCKFSTFIPKILTESPLKQIETEKHKLNLNILIKVFHAIILEGRISGEETSILKWNIFSILEGGSILEI